MPHTACSSQVTQTDPYLFHVVQGALSQTYHNLLRPATGNTSNNGDIMSEADLLVALGEAAGIAKASVSKGTRQRRDRDFLEFQKFLLQLPASMGATVDDVQPVVLVAYLSGELHNNILSYYHTITPLYHHTTVLSSQQNKDPLMTLTPFKLRNLTHCVSHDRMAETAPRHHPAKRHSSGCSWQPRQCGVQPGCLLQRAWPQQQLAGSLILWQPMPEPRGAAVGARLRSAAATSRLSHNRCRAAAVDRRAQHSAAPCHSHGEAAARQSAEDAAVPRRLHAAVPLGKLPVRPRRRHARWAWTAS